MSERVTIKQLNNWADNQVLLYLIADKKDHITPNSAMYNRLTEIAKKLETVKE